MTSPALIVNDVIQWLNAAFGLRIPTLPLTGWPAVIKTLWSMFIGGSPPLPWPPEGNPPWIIPIEGTLAVFPPEAVAVLENLCIVVEQKDY